MNPIDRGAFFVTGYQVSQPKVESVISQKPLNKSAIVMLSYFHQEGDEIVANVPLTAKVVDVHQLKNKMYRINCDARGVIHEPHGIERILLTYAKKLIEEKEK